MMTYKGYTAKVEYHDGDQAFHGHVIDLAHHIHFAGTSVEELEQAFRDSVDTYLALCEEEGIEPAKPYSGQLRLRMSPDLHRRAHVAAERRGISLNELLVSAIEKEVA